MNKFTLATVISGIIAGLLAISTPAHAGLNPQGLNPQGLNPQGLNPQGLNPQDVSLAHLTFSDFTWGGLPLQYMSLWDSQLRGYVFNGGWDYKTGTELIGAMATTHLEVDGQADLDVELLIVGVQTDDTNNTFISGWPSTPDYFENDDIWLYTILYREVGDSYFDNLCGGDGKGMFFEGVWDKNSHDWSPSSSQFTFACTSGVISKCARNWGYKPWRYLQNARGDYTDLGVLHQGCVRAAKADYTGNGSALTVRGTMIDMFDNHGFNVPVSTSDLQYVGFYYGVNFEGIFSNSSNSHGADDYWANYMYQSRYNEWSELGGVPSLQVSNWSVGVALSVMDYGYSIGRTDIAVYTPEWRPIAEYAAQDSTSDSNNHFTPTCTNQSTHAAPDRAYRWTAPWTGTFKFTTKYSNFDTILTLREGNNEVACNDDASGLGLQSAVSRSFTVGETITITIDGYGSKNGDYVLNVYPL